MSAVDPGSRAQIEAVYRRLAGEFLYRPEAPSDGFGNITMPLEELDLDAEAAAYAEMWWESEDHATFVLGSANWQHRPAMIYLLEAARACCGANRELALPLARAAVAELEEVGA